MKIRLSDWQALSTYLYTDRKMARNHSHLSRFKILCKNFAEKEFTRENFTLFLQSLQERNSKNSYLNSYIKIAKSVARCFKIDGFEDYTYFKEFTNKDFPYLTNEDIEKLAIHYVAYYRDADVINFRMRCLIFTLGIVGGRITETLKLRKSDIGIEEIEGKKIAYMRFRAETTKTSQDRVCPIPQWLYNDLLKLPDADTLFNTKHSQTVYEDVKRRATEIKLEKKVWNHLFRYSSINNKLRAGMSLVDVSKFHGHANVTTTQKYYVLVALSTMAESLSLDYFYKEDLSFLDANVKARKSLAKIYNMKQYKHYVVESEEEIVFTVVKLPLAIGDSGI